MENVRFTAPTPEVQHLPTLFRRIQGGEIRIPAFQRQFVWKEKQVLEILESVYKGYPIGSLLFWRVDQPILLVEHATQTSFPEVEERYPLSFVLDGLQRLSTLYGVFHNTMTSSPHMFNVVFDLGEERFAHFDSDADLSTTINLAHIFSPRDFLAAQRQLSEHNESETLLERTVLLHSIFQEYMVPTVTLSQRSLEEVVQIFERVNSTGTKLDTVDFMRAVTWSEQFDLTTHLNKLSDSLAVDGFSIPTETLLKVVAVVSDRLPTSASMLSLKSESAEKLKGYVTEAQGAVRAAVRFLNSECRVFSYDFVPYEGQLLVLARFFQRLPDGGPDHLREALRKWFWTVSFNEELRGKPDHYVVRLLRRLDAMVDGESEDLALRLAISNMDFVDRRMLAGAALSGAVAALFALNDAASLLSGELIPAESFMSSFNTEQFVPIFSAAEIAAALGRQVHSSKLMANVVLARDVDMRPLRALDGATKLRTAMEVLGQKAESVFHSQFLTRVAVTAALAGDVLSFLQLRGLALLEAAQSLTD